MYFNPCKVHYITSLEKSYNRSVKGTALKYKLFTNKDKSKADNRTKE